MECAPVMYLLIRNQRESNPLLLTNINTIPRPGARNNSSRLTAQLIEGGYESYWELEGEWGSEVF